ncbi:hypothetical protein JT06_15820 [Desulfobulbus sp. Tol-SR]|nr:hypothetical protein JT06_15820 [Desulfobulbus sp. Tol-SR]
MAVIVQRLPADKPGPDVYTFLKLPESLLEIGRQEINANGQNVVNLSMQLIGNDYIEPGSIIKVLYMGTELFGMVTSFSSVVTVTNKAASINTTMSVEIPQ